MGIVERCRAIVKSVRIYAQGHPSTVDWVLTFVALLAAAVVPMLWDLAPPGEDRFGHPGFWSSLVVAGISIVVGFWQVRRSQQRTARAEKSLTGFNENLSDTVRALSRLIDSDRTSADRQAFLESVVAEAKSLIGLASPRICVYMLEANDTTDEGPAQPTYFLKRQAWGGRRDAPREFFTADTEHGQAAIAAANGTVVRSVDDRSRPSFAIDRDPDARWESFLLAPISVGGKARGIISIDTTELTVFTPDHKAVALTIASFVEIGITGVASAAKDTRPEVRDAQRRLAALRQHEREASGMGPVGRRRSQVSSGPEGGEQSGKN